MTESKPCKDNSPNKWQISRRGLLKAAGMAGVMTMLPSFFAGRSFSFSAVAAGNFGLPSNGQYPDWIAEARILGFPISGVMVDPASMEIALDRAVRQHANVLEADSRLSDYLTDEDFESELQLMKDTTRLVHERGLKIVWYYPTLEVITPNGRFRQDTLGRMHPDWLQLSFDQERRGVFYGQKVFWVEPNDESAWMCPNSPYREWYKSRLCKLAGTGVDGLWLDVPLFGLIVGRWGCACSYCLDKFSRQTGMDFPGRFDVSDKRFWRYVSWRHETLTEFIEDCKAVIQSVNSEVITIAEVVALDHLGAVEWGTEGSSMRNNFVVWEEDGSSETTAMADASYDDWMAQYNIYKYCRGATMERPSWAFCYGYDDPDSQLVMAGAVASQNNPYELRVPKMTTTVGMEFRGIMYRWIEQYSRQIFRAHSLAPALVLYSERNRDYLDTLNVGGMVISDAPPMRDRQWLGMKEGTPLVHDYMGDYRGLSIFLFQNQIPADVYPFSRVDEELLKYYKVIVLPYMKTLTEGEKGILLSAVENGATLIVSGPEPGSRDENGSIREPGFWAEIAGPADGDTTTVSLGRGRIFFWKEMVGREYLRTKDDRIASKLLSVMATGGVVPWTVEKADLVIQPYVYEDQVVVHVLNYTWIGALHNQPNRFTLELSIPWDVDTPIVEIFQSEPQFDTPRKLTFAQRGNLLQIPMEVGINALVIINTRTKT